MKKLHTSSQYSELLNKLKIDCEKCSGLCCVALYFAKSEGFPADKAPGEPCKNLMSDFRCSIHSKLAQCKLKGCMAFDCFGAGQKVTQSIYLNKIWCNTPKKASEIYDVFLIIYRLHQMLWYLLEASAIAPAAMLEKDMEALILENEHMTNLPPDEILTLDIDNYRTRVNQVLKKAAKLVFAATNSTAESRSNTDFMGKNFKNTNLDGKDFSMALLIAANLEGCSLYGTNFLGADLRDTNIKNADLSESIFLAQGQVNAAIGNRNTKLPAVLTYPTTWQ